MGFRSGITVSLALLFAGCGGGGNEEGGEAVLSGVFQGGDVRGLSYRTPSQSGVTDASGTFHYLAGETVTFSIGAIELGSAPGASAITPFTLAGLTPPTTELALRRELKRAISRATPFVRAINVGRLLLVLDSDGNPANGIDLRGRENVLANATVDFGRPIPQFAEQLDELAPNLPQNIPNWAPVVHLYRSLNIAVPAHATVRTESQGGFVNIGATAVAITTYLPNGLLEGTTDDANGDGIVERETSRLYDSLGRGLGTREYRRDSLIPGYRQSSNVRYDSIGNAVFNDHEVDYGADGVIESRAVADFTFDSFGRPLTVVQASRDGINRIVYQSTQALAYDSRGNPASSVLSIDNDGDSVVDERVYETFSFDGRDRPTRYVYEEDFDADGVMDSRHMLDVSWAADGRQATHSNVVDQDADGTPDYSSSLVWSYDAAANLASFLQERDDGANGTVDYRERATLTYDSEGRETRNVQTHDFDGDGITDESLVLTRAYDAIGNVTGQVQEFDHGADGVPNSRYADSFTFGSSGEPLGLRTEIDSGADGTVELTSQSTDTNLVIDAGVAMLAQKYFEGGGYTSAAP